MRLRRFSGVVLGAAVALVVALASAPIAGARDLQTIQADAQLMADQVSSLERDLERLRGRAARLETDIDLATQALGELQLQVEAAEQELGSAHERFESRAIEVYKAGPTAQLELMLSSQTLAELNEVAQIASRTASMDSESIEELAARRAEISATQEEIDARKQEMLAAQQETLEVKEGIVSALSSRRDELADLNDQIAALEAQARRAAKLEAARSNISVDQALLDILGGSGPAADIPDGFVSTGVSFEGSASWYGPGFEGNHTANGDIFDSSLFTAASKELPLGSWLFVEFQGKGVVVYVNDRGPYVGDRVLDLSKGAAEAIGLIGPGVGWVRAEIIIKT